MKILFSILCLLFLFIGSADAGTLTATLTWTNPDTIDGIQVEKSNSPTGTFGILNQIAAGTTTYADTTNSPGDQSCYRIAYFNSSGVGPYAGPVCKVFPTVPTQTPGSFVVK